MSHPAKIASMSSVPVNHYPHVAIVSSNPLRSDMANGIFMQSLFSGWPKDRLAQIYFKVAMPNMPDSDVCDDYRMITMSGLTHRCHPRKNEREANPTSSDTNHGKLNGKRLVMQHLRHRSRLFPWLKAGQEAWSAHGWLQRSLERQLKKVRPEIVYGLLGNYCLTKITYSACQKLGLPLFVHVTDDFVTSKYHGVPFSATFHQAAKRWLGRAVGYSSGCAAICPAMAEEYQQRYGGHWTWFTTVLDANRYDPNPRVPDGVVRLVYAGNLGLRRWHSLRKLALALRELATRQGIEVRLAIYAPPEEIEIHRKALDLRPTVELRGWAHPAKLPRLFHDSDILVHAESFDPQQALLTKWSFSTKLSQYMMAGRCILALGPPELASIRLVRDEQVGISLTDFDANKLTRELEPLIQSNAMRRTCGENGRRWALTWCEHEKQHDRFRQELVNGASHSHQVEPPWQDGRHADPDPHTTAKKLNNVA